MKREVDPGSIVVREVSLNYVRELSR